MATIYHFQPWITKSAKTFLSALSAPTDQFNKLKKQNLIKPVKVYPYLRNPFRYNQFYSLVPDKIANSMIEHQSGLIDVLMAFIYLYPDFDVNIKYTPHLMANGKIYKPDALVKLDDFKGNQYDFIIEFERSRNPIAIYNEKLAKNEKMPSFKELGLSQYTKILYIYCHERFNVFNRPIQYDLPEVKLPLQALNSGFASLMNIAAKLPDHKYRFLPYHQFNQLDICQNKIRFSGTCKACCRVN